MISWFDIKKSLSFLLKDYKYSSVIVLSMAFSLGIALFLYTQIYTIQYKNLEFDKSDQIVSISRVENDWVHTTGGIYYFEFTYLNERLTSFEYFGRYEERLATLQTDAFSERVNGAAVNSDLFKVASGVEPLKGRVLNAEDDIHGSAQVAVISYDLWQNLFDGRQDILGQLATLNGLVYSIVGVMPQGFRFPIDHDIWVSYPLWHIAEAETSGWNTVVARLRDGVSIDQARAEIDALSADLRREYPNHFMGKGVHVVPYTQAFSAGMRTSVGIMTIIGIAILLMGCFSVSNLLIVRMLESERESVIKSALGIPYWRIAVRPLLESFWMCLLAGTLAVILCALSIGILGGHMYSEGPYWWVLELYPAVFVAAFVLSVMMWIVTGFVPVLLSMRAPSNSALSSGRKGGAGGKSGPLMSGLIGVQVICAFVMMVLTGLSVEALTRTLNAEYGVKMEGAIVADVRLSEFSHPSVSDRVDYYESLRQEVSSDGRISRVAFSSGLPGFGTNSTTYLKPGSVTASGRGYDRIFQVSVCDELFDALDMRVISGRSFNRFDTEDSSLVGIVDERTAYMLDPSGDVVGRQIQIDIENNGPLITIIGVVNTVFHGSPLVEQSSVFGNLYRPMRQLLPPWGTMHMVANSESTSYEVFESIRQAGRRTDPQIAIAAVMTYPDRLALQTRQLMTMISSFLPAALLAFLMASVGIYGISTRITMQKANDFGVMKALGATDRNIISMFLKKTWLLLFGSLVVGVGILMLVLPSVVSWSFVVSGTVLMAVTAIVMLLIFFMVTGASTIPMFRINKLSPQDALNFRLGS